ncbi:hypothetical protein C0989_000323 [Termitomyces sp. Mn162]|nr:hypothetical protein C0989_000323 [Termitomyces sp. Mn162]
MAPKESQETSKLSSLDYEFCDRCKCTNCVNILPSHDYWSDEGTSSENTSDEDSNSDKLGGLVAPDFVTPTMRITTKSLSTRQKKAVKDAAHAAAPKCEFDKTLGFCLVSLITDISDILQTCHVIPKGIVGNDDHMMKQLEYAWGLEYGQLNLNSRYNMMNPSLHISFDKSYWAMWSLDEEYITKLKKLKFTVENPLEEIYGEEKTFRYAFLPFPRLNRPILRLNEDKAPEKISVDDVTIHCSPYDTLQPILESHIKPHFVIFDLVTKLRRAEANIMELSQNREHVNRSTLNVTSTYLTNG